MIKVLAWGKKELLIEVFYKDCSIMIHMSDPGSGIRDPRTVKQQIGPHVRRDYSLQQQLTCLVNFFLFYYYSLVLARQRIQNTGHWQMTPVNTLTSLLNCSQSSSMTLPCSNCSFGTPNLFSHVFSLTT